LTACALVFIKTKPYIEKKDEAAKKKWFLIIRIIIIFGCIDALYLIVLGVLFITGIW
jgi:hypothetical protein